MERRRKKTPATTLEGFLEEFVGNVEGHFVAALQGFVNPQVGMGVLELAPPQPMAKQNGYFDARPKKGRRGAKVEKKEPEVIEAEWVEVSQ